MVHRTPKRPGVVCEKSAGPYEVSLNHLIGVFATPGRVHPMWPSPSGRSFIDAVAHHWSGIVTARSSVSLAPGRSPPHKAMYTLHCSFRTAASLPSPSDPWSPRRPGHQLPNFNDQSSGQDSHLLVNETVRRNGARRERRLPANQPGDSPGSTSSIDFPAVLVSGRGDSHPPALSGPDVTVSRHPAPTGRWSVSASCQWANRVRWRCLTALSHAHARCGDSRSRLYFCRAHRTMCSSMRLARECNFER